MNITVARMNREEIDLAMDWAAREGWNPGLYDAECFYAADPNGFFLARLDGEPVGSLSAVAYDDHFGFAGFYIVKPECRAHGIGHVLAEQARAYLGNRVIGNDAVVEQQDTYAQLGFRLAYRNVRYRGVASAGKSRADEIVDLRKRPFDELAVYDRGLFPAARPAFLKRWIDQPGGAALADVQDGRLGGYGVIRRCRAGYKVGPLFAESEQTAERLLGALVETAAGDAFFLDIPEPNEGAGRLVRRWGMQKVFETARMYLGPAPELPLHKIFGVTSFELG